MEGTFSSTKERTISHETWNYDEILSTRFMTTQQQDIPGKLELIMQYDKTIGGPAYELL